MNLPIRPKTPSNDSPNYVDPEIGEPKQSGDAATTGKQAVKEPPSTASRVHPLVTQAVSSAAMLPASLRQLTRTLVARMNLSGGHGASDEGAEIGRTQFSTRSSGGGESETAIARLTAKAEELSAQYGAAFRAGTIHSDSSLGLMWLEYSLEGARGVIVDSWGNGAVPSTFTISGEHLAAWDRARDRLSYPTTEAHQLTNQNPVEDGRTVQSFRDGVIFTDERLVAVKRAITEELWANPEVYPVRSNDDPTVPESVRAARERARLPQGAQIRSVEGVDGRDYYLVEDNDPGANRRMVSLFDAYGTPVGGGTSISENNRWSPFAWGDRPNVAVIDAADAINQHATKKSAEPGVSFVPTGPYAKGEGHHLRPYAINGQPALLFYSSNGAVHELQGAIYEFWQRNGGLMLGAPLDSGQAEGAGLRQYFEYPVNGGRLAIVWQPGGTPSVRFDPPDFALPPRP